jgi:aryl-alcohol dehydrogenase-like predicted oxidoreductase
VEQASWVSRSQGWPEYCCVQQRYSYLRPRPGASFVPQLVANEDLLDVCHYEQLTLLAYSVLLGGAYTRPERPLPEQYAGPDSRGRLAVLEAVAREAGATPNQVIPAWMVQGVPSILPLIAASTSQ